MAGLHILKHVKGVRWLHPDGPLRTVQRRLKIWRAEIAWRLVFATADGAPELTAPDALRDSSTINRLFAGPLLIIRP